MEAAVRDNNGVPAQLGVDENGNTKRILVDSDGKLPAQENSHTNITTATTTTVKATAGFLHSITVNSTAAGAITVYDSADATGTKIATLKASIPEGTYTFDVACANGLTVVTAAASDITVSSR